MTEDRRRRPVEGQRRENLRREAPRRRPPDRGYERRDVKNNKKHGDRTVWFLGVVVAALVIVVILLMMKRCQSENELVVAMPEFEEDAGRSASGDAEEKEEEKADEADMINLAVVPDFTVSKNNKYFLMPYPENNYDAEFEFLDSNGNAIYRTRRVVPGAVIRIPAYSFAKKGTNRYRIRVHIFDSKSYKEIPSAMALEMKITKK